MPPSANIMKNSIYLLSARVGILALNFFSTIFLARYLGVNEFGKYTLVMVFLSFFILICDFGLNRFIILKVSKTPELTATYSANMILLRIFLSLLGFGMMLPLTRLMGYSQEIFILICIAGLILLPSSINLTIDALVQGHEKMGISSLWQIVSTSLSTLTVLISIYLDIKLKGIFISLFIATCLNLILYFLIGVRVGLIIRSRIEMHFMVRSLRAALPYAITSLLGFIYFRADTVLLSLLETEKSVGLLGASYRIIEGLLVVPLVLMTAYFPRMSRYSISEPHAFNHLYRSSLTLLTTLAFPLGILCTVFSKDILRLIYGLHYDEASLAFSVLIWGLVLMYLNAPAGTAIQTSDRFYRFVPFAIGNTFLNIVLNLFLIPKYSILGASIAKVTSEITSFIILLTFTSKMFHVNLFFLLRPCYPALVAGGLMMLSILGMVPFHVHKWTVILLSTGIYLGVLFLFRKENIPLLLRQNGP